MFPMAGPGDLSRMMVHLQETVLMMRWPWLQAPSVLYKHTRTYTTTALHVPASCLKIPSLHPSQVIRRETFKFSGD